jgi:signal transduction histidine kinase
VQDFRIGICAASTLTIGVASLVQRDALSPPQWWIILLVAIAALPWTVDLFFGDVPPWIFAPAVLVPVALLHAPTRFDPLPVRVGLHARDRGLGLGPGRSSLIVALSAGVVLWHALGTTAPQWGLGRLLAIGAGWLAGLTFWSQIRRISELKASQAQMLAQAEAAARVRVGAEVTESLSEVVAHLSTAQEALDQGDPDRLRGSLQEAEQLIRLSIDELARTTDTARLGPIEEVTSP